MACTRSSTSLDVSKRRGVLEEVRLTMIVSEDNKLFSGETRSKAQMMGSPATGSSWSRENTRSFLSVLKRLRRMGSWMRRRTQSQSIANHNAGSLRPTTGTSQPGSRDDAETSPLLRLANVNACGFETDTLVDGPISEVRGKPQPN